jgi:hypothetical protein
VLSVSTCLLDTWASTRRLHPARTQVSQIKSFQEPGNPELNNPTESMRKARLSDLFFHKKNTKGRVASGRRRKVLKLDVDTGGRNCGMGREALPERMRGVAAFGEDEGLPVCPSLRVGLGQELENSSEGSGGLRRAYNCAGDD